MTAVAPTLADWQRCEEIAREHGRTFHFASRFLPPQRRRAMLAAYAYCRVADDIVDRAERTGPDAASTAIDAWESELD
ncbi:MAG: squalene/phytoene synthase family protein, partial [Thermomicrobiales bacterium]